MRFFDIRLADVRKEGFGDVIAFNHGKVFFGDERHNLQTLMKEVATLLSEASDQFVILDLSNGESTFSYKNVVFFVQALGFLVIINIALALFNLIPVPPNEGGQVALTWLPKKWAAKWSKLEPYGIPIAFVLALLVSPIFMAVPFIAKFLVF